MKNIEMEILKALKQSTDPISFKKLSQNISVSIKTIQNKMNNLKKDGKHHGFTIYSTQGKGHKIVIEDHKLYDEYVKILKSQENKIDTPFKRQKYILRYLIEQDRYITINELASNLYISNSCISLDLKEIKHNIEKFDLSLISSPTKGIKIQGLENNKRLCLKNMNDMEDLFSKDSLSKILKTIIVPVVNEYHLSISDLGLQNIAIHLMLASQRIDKNQIIDFNKPTATIDIDQKEYSVALQIAKRAEIFFHIQFPNSEVEYLRQHILGNQYLSTCSNLEKDDKYKNAYILCNQMLKHIYKKTKLDFFEDTALKNDIILHLIPFLSRINHRSMIKNPLNLEIQSRYVYAFELASIGISIIEKEYNVKISSDEISYFAIYYAMALERIEMKSSKYNFLIVCYSGKATSKLLMFQLRQKFSEYIKNIETVEYYQLDQIDLDSFDFIITTVPLPIEFKNNHIIQINDLLLSEDINSIAKIMKYSNYSIRSIVQKELFFTLNSQPNDSLTCIKEIVGKISEKIKLPVNFIDKIIERENMFPTDIASFIAIPHTIEPVTDFSFVSVTILNKPIYWNHNMVQIVFLLSIAKNEYNELSRFYELLSSFINDMEKIQQVLKSKDYETFIKILES